MYVFVFANGINKFIVYFMFIFCKSKVYRVVQKKVDHHAVCDHNLHKLLLNNGFIFVECTCQREDPETIKN